MNKMRIWSLIVGLLSFILVLYYILSLSIMNYNPYVLHYYGYHNIEEAKQKGGLLKADVNYKLTGFTEEKQQIIQDNIFIFTTKSHYEELYGFLIKIKHEDREMLRVNFGLKDEKNGYGKIFDGKLKYGENYIGQISGASFDIFKNEKSITLEVIEYVNQSPVKLGEILIDLR